MGQGGVDPQTYQETFRTALTSPTSPTVPSVRTTDTPVIASMTSIITIAGGRVSLFDRHLGNFGAGTIGSVYVIHLILDHVRAVQSLCA